MELTKPYQECPEFENCSVNKCPLDSEAADRVSLPEDPEARCKARISTRTAIAIKYHLPNKGMTERELRRDERSRRTRAWWDSLPEEERQRLTAGLKRSP